MSLATLLGPFVKENEAYVAELKQELEQCDEGFQEVDTHAGACSRVVQALKDDHLDEAVDEVLKHFEVDDKFEELRSIRAKLDAGEMREAVVTAANTPKLIREMLETAKVKIDEALAKIDELAKSGREIVERANEKLSTVKADWESWTWPERLGTPPALKKLAGAAKTAGESGGEAKVKLQTLHLALEQLRATKAHSS